MLLELLKNNAPSAAILATVIAALLGVLFQIYKFLAERRQELYWKEFEKYHALVKLLVSPDEPNAQMYIDRQTAIIFELRNFPRYREHSIRMLQGLKKSWSPGHHRIQEELDIALKNLDSGSGQGT
jgi:hypothetical protein